VARRRACVLARWTFGCPPAHYGSSREQT